MPSPAWLVGRDGRVIWDGDSNALLPDPGTLVREIRSDEGVPDLSLLRRCVELVLVHATPASLPTWCSWLCCLGDPGPTLRSLRDSSGGSRVCGYVFKRGDIAWNCRRCQVDSTCVQCDACFRRSDHTGHPVYFHRTAPGGCCDCGDEEAWAEAGCCDRHRAPSSDKDAVDPLASLPPDFEAVARLVVRGVVLFLGGVAWSSLDTFDPAALESAGAPDQDGRTPGGGEYGGAAGAGVGRLGVAVDAFTVSGPYRGRAQGQGGRGGESQVMVRVHNDDVHTFDQVIDTFIRLGHSRQRAQELTQQVDEKGMASVYQATRAKALTMLRFLCSQGLMASVCDGAHVELESRGLALLTWLGSLCSQTDGLRRVVAQELVAATRSPTPANALPLSKTPLDSSAEKYSASSHTGAGNRKSGSNLEFNSSLWRRSDVFGLSAERGYLWVNRIRGDGDGIPAEAAAPYWVAREAPLGVLIGADPMLARPLRVALHGLLMRLLVDQEFKRDFALAFARLYEFLNAMYCRGIGVSDESIFGFSVQTFTTPSLVRLLADVSATTSSALLPNPDNEVLPRVWGFAETPGLLAMLMKALVRTMRSAGCRGCGRRSNSSSDHIDENAFLDHDITVHKRFLHVFRDLEYALQSPGTALDVATQATNPGPGSEPLKLWFKVLLDLQYMDTNVRQRGLHVEYESRRFMGAFGLSFSLASVTEALVDRALRKAPPPPISASAASQRKPAAATSALNLAGDDISDSSAQRSAGCEAVPEGSWNAGGGGGSGIGPGVSVGGRGEWAEESRRIEAGEGLSWRALVALKMWVDNRKGSNVYRVVSAPTPQFGLNPTLGKRVDFRVHTHAVSVHLPLHRFFCKVVQTLSQEGMAIPRVPEEFLLPLVEFPMRALVFHAQVMARLWVRNGAAAHSQAASYASPPMCRHMRDLDMIALQVGCLYMGIDNFLGLLLNKFDLDEWFLDPVDKTGPQDSATGAAASDSCLPPPPQPHGNLNADAIAEARSWPSPGAAAPSATPPGLAPPQASPRTPAIGTAYASRLVGNTSQEARLSRIRKLSPEVRLLLAEDCLSLLIALLTELPRPGGRASARGALRREVVHRLASSECTHSEVAAVVSNLAEPASEEFLDEVLREVGEVRDSSASARSAAAAVAATVSIDGGVGPGAAVGDGTGTATGTGAGKGSGGRRSGRVGGATKYGLAASAVGEYDPTFVRLGRTEHQAAVETIVRKRKSRSSSSRTPLPIVGTPPPAHAKFLPVRQGLLYSPVIVRAVRSVLRNYASKKTGKTSDLLLSRALHVLTLQLHGLDRPQQQPYQQPGKGSCSSGSIEAPVNAGGVEETKGGGGIRGGCPLVSGFSQSAYFAAVLEESSKASDSDSGKAGAGLQGRGRGLLGELRGGDVGAGGSLCEVLGKVAVDHGALGALFEDGLQWVVREFARRNPLCREILGRLGALPEAERVASLEGRDAGSMDDRGSSDEYASSASASSLAAAGGGGGRSAGTTLAEKKKKAQAMAMEAMRKRQAAFAKHVGLGSLEDDTDEDSVAAAETKDGATSSKAGSPSEASLEEGSPECIMCHERSGWAMGYLGLAQRSSVLSTGVAVNPHRGLLRRQMLVVGKHGCQLRRGIDVKSEKVQVLRPGRRCEVLVGEQVGRRVRCIAPAVGWASVRDSDGDTILAPLETKAFERWGRQRLHIGLCGHAVHFACWDTYFASLVERSLSRQTFDGRMSVDVNRSEFFCPLCKSLSNTLIAHIPRGAHASNLFPPAPGVGAIATVIAGDADSPSGEAPNSREQQQQQQRRRQEKYIVERLSTADGLAEWVLLEEDGGLGVVGAMGREGGGGEKDDMEVDVDVVMRTAEVEAREGFVLVGGDVGTGQRRGKGRKERLPLQFGVPRSGLGGALAAGFSTRKKPRDVKQEEQSKESSGDGGHHVSAAYAKVVGAMSLRRLADSLREASHPPWSSPSELQGPSGIRMLHQLWAAAGYTAAATEATSRAEWTPGEREGGTGVGEGVGGSGPGPGGEVLRANETLHLRRLLRVVEHGVALLDDAGRDASAAAANRGGPTSSSTGARQPRATASAARGARSAVFATAGGPARELRGIAFPTAAGNRGSAAVDGQPSLAAALAAATAAAAALPMGDDLSSASESSGDGGWMEGGGALGSSDDSGALGVLAAAATAAAAAAAADQAVPLPSGGMVAAIKLARVIGGAAVVPPREGIKKPPVAGGGGGVGRQKQGSQKPRRSGGRSGHQWHQWILRREEAWWIRRGVEMPMQVVKDQESIKIASQLISFKGKQREALRRAVAVARTYFFLERHRERVNSRAAAAAVASSATKDDDNALIQPLPPEAASLLETVWEADTAWPLMQTPLLAWDLTTLLIGGMSMAPSWSGRAGVVRAACVARLCQAILQPEMCLRGPGGAAAAAALAMMARGSATGVDERGPRGQKRRQMAKPMGGNFGEEQSGGGDSRGGGKGAGGGVSGRTVPSVAAALEALRNALAEATETPVSPMAPEGEDLIAICYASWLPFLRCAALVIAAACSSHNSTDANESGGGSRMAGWSGDAAINMNSAEGGEEAWRQRVVAAYNSSGRLFRGGGGGDGKPIAYSQGIDVGGGRAGAGAGGCVAAVEELCAALGVPLPQDLATSWSALTMVRCWGKQFAGAFGPAQKRAGVCDIGGEALSLSAVEACLRESPKRGLPAEAEAYGSGDGVGVGGTSSGVGGDFRSDEGDDDAAAATADGIEALSGSGGSGEGSSGVGVGGGGGRGVLLGMPMDAEVAADNGAGAAEAMGFDVLEIGGGDWMELGIGGGVGGGAWAGGIGGGVLLMPGLDEDALQDADDVGAEDEDDPEDAHQDSANAGPAAAATAAAGAGGEWQAIGNPNPPLPPPPPPIMAPQGPTAPASVPPASAQHQSNQAATSGNVSLWANRDRVNFRFPIPKVLVPYLGNLTGGYTTPDETGVPLKSVLFDVSHLGLSCQDNLDLVELPESYTELYGRAQSPHASAAAAAAAAEGGAGHDTDPAVCLVCGQVVAAGSKPNDSSPGECTIHARYCGSGIGIFFLVQRCVVLLIRDSRGAYYPSIYLDDHGEEDAGLKRGRPLFLNRHRYNALKQVYLRHRVAQEVSTIRASSDRVIRENYY